MRLDLLLTSPSKLTMFWLVGRPKEFDRDVALEAAKSVFWRQGFNGTSTDDLRLAMGIGRQSFYDTFGGKREVFLEALRKYMSDQVSEYFEKLRSESPFNGIRELLLSIANEPADDRARGCLGVLSVCEFGTGDKDVSDIAGSAGKLLDRLLENVLRDARARGEVRSSLDVRAAARFLRTTLIGLRVAARGGATPEMLREIGDVALDGLRAPRN